MDCAWASVRRRLALYRQRVVRGALPHEGSQAHALYVAHVVMNKFDRDSNDVITSLGHLD